MKPANDYEWLVKSRAKVQHLLLDLYAFLQDQHELLLQNHLERASLQLLIGATFSLWRAAFLADTERSASTILRNAEEFLEFVVRDNSINYPQDRKTQAWSLGYYLNNARYRLLRLLPKLTQLDGDAANSRAFDWLRALDDSESVDCDPKVTWEMSYEAICGAFAVVSRSTQRPK